MHQYVDDCQWFGEGDDRKCCWQGRCTCGWVGEWHDQGVPVAPTLAKLDYKCHVEAEMGAQAYYDAPVGCRNCGSQHEQPVLMGLHVTAQACHRCGTTMLQPNNEVWDEMRENTKRWR